MESGKLIDQQDELFVLHEDIMSLASERKKLLASLTPNLFVWEDESATPRGHLVSAWRIAGKASVQEMDSSLTEPAAVSGARPNWQQEELENYFDFILQDLEDLGHRMLSIADNITSRKLDAPISLYKKTELFASTSRLMEISEDLCSNTNVDVVAEAVAQAEAFASHAFASYAREEEEAFVGEARGEVFARDARGEACAEEAKVEAYAEEVLSAEENMALSNKFLRLCNNYLERPETYTKYLALIITEEEKEELEDEEKQKQNEEGEEKKNKNKKKKEQEEEERKEKEKKKAQEEEERKEKEKEKEEEERKEKEKEKEKTEEGKGKGKKKAEEEEEGKGKKKEKKKAEEGKGKGKKKEKKEEEWKGKKKAEAEEEGKGKGKGKTTEKEKEKKEKEKKKEKNKKNKEEEEEEEDDYGGVFGEETDSKEYLKKRMVLEQEFFSNRRIGWEHIWGSKIGRCGGFHDTTTLSPMHFTHCTPDIIPHGAVVGTTLQIYSFEIEMKTDWMCPLNVYGVVAARDTVDRNRNLLFCRSKVNYQVLTPDDPFLRLTGPSRAILALYPVDFEVELKIDDGNVSQDRALISLSLPYYGQETVALFHSSLCTGKLRLEQIDRTVQATIVGVRLAEGDWPFKYGARVVCSVSAAASLGMELLLLDSHGEEVTVAADGYLPLSRNVVSVELNSGLKVDIQAYSETGCISAQGHVYLYRPKHCNIRQVECLVGDCRVEITVAWSRLVQDKMDLLTEGYAAQA